jgi:Icc-related predicted phosphoesterase
MKIVCVSDTHGQHNNLRNIPDGDVLIHAGDLTNDAGRASLRSFLVWFEAQPHRHKIFIAGNHDWAFQKWPDLAKAMVKEVAPSVHYLQDSGVELEGVKFWGSPVQPFFLDWAFNRVRGDDIQRHWDMIPNDTQVLITHGPAHGRLDLLVPDVYGNGKADRAGCHNLKATIEARLKALQLHVFGHLHYQGGQQEIDGGVTYINAAVVDDGYTLCRKPQVTYIDPYVGINFPAHEQSR